VSESDPLDRLASPEEIEMMERLLKLRECGVATKGAAGAEEFNGGAGAADVAGASTEALGHGCHRGGKSMPNSKTRVPRATRRSRARKRPGAYRDRPNVKVTYLFDADPAFKRLVEATPSGMAHGAGTGPPSTVCEQCSSYGYSRRYPYSCYRYYEMRSEHGAELPADTPSCKHFAPRGPEPK
jgi:hypothetical protein